MWVPEWRQSKSESAAQAAAFSKVVILQRLNCAWADPVLPIAAIKTAKIRQIIGEMIDRRQIHGKT
jgi:hypothetical protein